MAAAVQNVQCGDLPTKPNLARTPPLFDRQLGLSSLLHMLARSASRPPPTPPGFLLLLLLLLHLVLGLPTPCLDLYTLLRSSTPPSSYILNASTLSTCVDAPAILIAGNPPRTPPSSFDRLMPPRTYGVSTNRSHTILVSNMFPSLNPKLLTSHFRRCLLPPLGAPICGRGCCSHRRRFLLQNSTSQHQPHACQTHLHLFY
jgi:hypothetical protein